jgi:hypothetical protein
VVADKSSLAFVNAMTKLIAAELVHLPVTDIAQVVREINAFRTAREMIRNDKLYKRALWLKQRSK